MSFQTIEFERTAPPPLPKPRSGLVRRLPMIGALVLAASTAALHAAIALHFQDVFYQMDVELPAITIFALETGRFLGTNLVLSICAAGAIALLVVRGGLDRVRRLATSTFLIAAVLFLAMTGAIWTPIEKMLGAMENEPSTTAAEQE